jgi:class 3 adenylate cyclase/tetratricopeptide (TPR) repeat protein
VPEVRKTVTVVFTDVAGSTALGEQLDPESLRRVLSRYFEEMRAVVERHGGTVEKFIGDAVMAVFGIPVLHEDDALRAVRAAVEMRGALATLNEELEQDWGARLQIRTGVNTGEVMAGDFSAGQAMVTGDAVNVAARLEQAARPDEILIGEETHRLVRHAIRVEPVEPLDLKGKAKRVSAVRLIEVSSGAPAFLRRLDSPLVGRDDELDVLRTAFDGAASGPACRVVTVVGEAGMGKSRLVNELIDGLGDRATVLQGRCLPYGEGLTFWPVAEAVKSAAGVDEADSPDEAISRIRELLEGVEDANLILDRVSAAIGLAPAGGSDIRETFWAVRRLLESLATDRPIVFVIDDIHWAEPALLDLIQYLQGFSTGHPLLLVCTARPEVREARPDWGTSGQVISLGPLSNEGSETLIENLLGRAGLAGEVRDRITQAAEGNPLFVEEMLRMLIDEGLLARDDGHWVPQGDISKAAVPGTIQALLSARLDRLGSEERTVIQGASVVGKVFYWGAVVELSPEEQRSAVGGHLQTLLRKELIIPDRSSFAGEDAFRFSHILIRDAAYESTPKQARAALHEGFARWLQRVAGDRITEYEEIVGHHLEQAHRYRKELGPLDERGRDLAREAARWLASSGKRAFARSDMAAAAHLFERAAALMPADDLSRLEMLVDLTVALRDSGRLDRAIAVLDEVEEAASATGDERLAAHAAVVRFRVRLMTDPEVKLDDALAQAEHAVTVFERVGDERGLARAWNLIAWAHGYRGRAAPREKALERAFEHARRAGDRQEEIESLSNMTSPVAYGPVEASKGLQRLEEIRERAGEDHFVEASVFWARSILLAIQGRAEEGRRQSERAIRLHEDLGQIVNAATVKWEFCQQDIWTDPDSAERELRWCVDTLERLGETGYLSTAAAILADAIYLQGQYEEAERFTRMSEETSGPDDLVSQAGWRRVRAKILARRGQVEAAVALAKEAVAISQPSDYPSYKGEPLMDLAEVLRLAGRTVQAEEAAKKALSLFEQKGNVVSAHRARALIADLTLPAGGASP